MLPTLRPGDWVFTRPLSLNSLKRGRVILIQRAQAKSLYVKRLIGLPSETIRTHQASVWVDGQLLDEAYVLSGAELEPKADVEYPLGSDEVFVLGDARDDSADSRRWGPVKTSAVVGVVVFRFWPFGFVSG